MKRLLAIFLSMALLAFGVFHALRDADATHPGSMTASLPSTQGVAAAPVPKAVPTAVDPAASMSAGTVNGQTPAWMLPASRPATSNPAAVSTTVATSSEKVTRLRTVLDKLNRLQAQPNIDTGAAAAVIAELERISGSAVMNGVRLDVLRENMETAGRIETTAKELQRLQQSSAPASPERTALIQFKTDELVALQSRIRNDIVQVPGDAEARP